MPLDWSRLPVFNKSPEDILRNRQAGVVYSADFQSGEGRYISSVVDSDDPIDAVVKVSPRIEIRLTYIIKDSKVNGLQIAKLNINGKLDRVSLSTFDWDQVQALLHVFGSVDLKSVATHSLILDSTIVTDPERLSDFLNTVASDPKGRQKLEELFQNFGFIKAGDVDGLAKRRLAKNFMNKLLNDSQTFRAYKEKLGVEKNEEVWQRFFQKNDWLLGSDIVEILDERRLDEHTTLDLPVKSLDGYLDIIELKLPSALVWTQHNNPRSELMESVMQCMRYISAAETSANNHQKVSELGVDIVKPRITLIYGRSDGWGEEEIKRFRIMNSSFHNITILTYDQVLKRASKIIGEDEEK